MEGWKGFYTMAEAHKVKAHEGLVDLRIYSIFTRRIKLASGSYKTQFKFTSTLRMISKTNQELRLNVFFFSPIHILIVVTQDIAAFEILITIICMQQM